MDLVNDIKYAIAERAVKSMYPQWKFSWTLKVANPENSGDGNAFAILSMCFPDRNFSAEMMTFIIANQCVYCNDICVLMEGDLVESCVTSARICANSGTWFNRRVGNRSDDQMTAQILNEVRTFFINACAGTTHSPAAIDYVCIDKLARACSCESSERWMMRIKLLLTLEPMVPVFLVCREMFTDDGITTVRYQTRTPYGYAKLIEFEFLRDRRMSVIYMTKRRLIYQSDRSLSDVIFGLTCLVEISVLGTCNVIPEWYNGPATATPDMFETDCKMDNLVKISLDRVRSDCAQGVFDSDVV